MTFEELVACIKKDGCSVSLYNKTCFADGLAGYFRFEEVKKPHIYIAKRNRGKILRTALLCHEYAHYCQFKDGTMQRIIKELGSWEQLDNWLDRKTDFSLDQLRKIRDGVLLLEWDAEVRGWQIAQKYNLKVGKENSWWINCGSYIDSIKADIDERITGTRVPMTKINYMGPADLWKVIGPRE